LAHSSPVTSAIQELTKTIPVVFVAVGDPIVNSMVKEIARPGGNVTGITNLFPSMGGKWLQLLKEVAPRIVRVGLLFNPELEFGKSYFPSIAEAASVLSVQVIKMPYRDVAEFGNAHDALATEPNSGPIIVPPLGGFPPNFIPA
jgi:putative ABC transport system substrate-binding protein